MVKLQVPGRVAYRDLATRMTAFVCKMASQQDESVGGLEPVDFSDELVSAVGEAFNNIAIHGYPNGGGGEVVILLSFDNNHMRVELTDHGKTFDPEAAVAPAFERLPESGMGLYIIRSFVDEVDYSPGPPNVLSLTKFLAGSLVSSQRDAR